MAVRVESDHRFHSTGRELIERIVDGFTVGDRVERRELKIGEIKVRGMNFGNPSELQSYINFLTDPRNSAHFAHPPKDVRELREKAREPRDHFLIATRVERAKGKLVEKIVGGARLTDNVPPENEHWISLVVVDPEKQGQGIGKKMLEGIAEWGYDHKTIDGRKRDHLHLGITMGVVGWQAMEKIAKESGFKLINNLGKEVDYWEIKYSDKTNELHPTNTEKVLHGERLSFQEINMPDGSGRTFEQARMNDGTIVEIVKLSTRRLGFSYLEDLKSDHPVIRLQEENQNKIEVSK